MYYIRQKSNRLRKTCRREGLKGESDEETEWREKQVDRRSARMGG